MPRALQIALALLRIPHLAVSLFAFPLLLSLIIVCAQLLATGALVQIASSSTQPVSTISATSNDFHPYRWLLYGSGDPRPPVRICRWTAVNGAESPPSSDCAPDRLDVAVRVPEPLSTDVSRFVELFQGHVDRIHVCASCGPDVVITPSKDGKTASTAKSLFGLAILVLPYSNKKIDDRRVALRAGYSEVQSVLGSVSMNIPEVTEAVGISSLKGTLPITANIAILVITALWLALRAHRKVLDYFSRNDVLLPLAAACGKQSFYSAIWILTIFRVGCFLFASVPLLYIGLRDIISSNVEDIDFAFSLSQSVVWALALISTLSFATVVASIAELKHRNAILSVAYRFLPLVGAFLGAVVWGGSFIVSSGAVGSFRIAISALPVVGIAPILVAPITRLPFLPMIIHATLATAALLWILRRNARWFAAHLEEV